MTLEAAFEQWVTQDATIADRCGNSQFTGGPGFYGFSWCNHPNHQNVRYSCAYCPNNCSDYIEADRSKLFKRFRIEYDMYRSYYDEKYHIDDMNIG